MFICGPRFNSKQQKVCQLFYCRHRQFRQTKLSICSCIIVVTLHMKFIYIVDDSVIGHLSLEISNSRASCRSIQKYANMGIPHIDMTPTCFSLAKGNKKKFGVLLRSRPSPQINNAPLRNITFLLNRAQCSHGSQNKSLNRSLHFWKT